MLKHTRMITKPFVLHLHGTDIRTLQYDPAWRDSILWGVRRARAVLYSTPDLAEHVLPLRADARYLPVPVSLAKLPPRPASTQRRVFFSSRWEAVKGLEEQLEIARILVRELPSDYEVAGLDWGPGADEARAIGLRLVPKMPPERYLAFMASSAAVVGQSAGILSSSELEALGMGVPLYAPLRPDYYPDAPPVGGGVHAWSRPEVVAAELLADVPKLPEKGSDGPKWISRTHETELAYHTLLALYPALLGR